MFHDYSPGGIAALRQLLRLVATTSVVVSVASSLAPIATAIQQNYKHLIGQTSRICGRVVTYTYEGKGCDVRLDLGHPYWNPAFYVVIPATAQAEFTAPPEQAFLFQDICITGLVEAGARSVPHVVALKQSQFELKTTRTVEPFGQGAHRGCGPIDTPKLLKNVPPNYSAEGIAQQIQGLVLLDAVVGIDGKVSDSRVVFGLLESLDREAREALKKWRFKPGTLDGSPVPTIVTIEMSFTLRK